MKYCLRLFIVIVFLFLLASPIFAVSVIVTDMPSTISATPFSVTVSVYGANAGKNYLRVDLFKDGTSNYFGETYNGSEWYFGSVGTSYFPIDIASSTSTASATFQAQIGEPSSTEYPGPGAYKLRIRRYTSATSYSASGSYDVTIDIPTPTPTSSPTPISAPTPTKTPTPVNTPTVAPTLTLPPAEPSSGPVSRKSSSLAPTPTSEPSTLGETTKSAEVLSAVDLVPEAEGTPTGSGSQRILIISLLFIGLGLALLSLVFIWKKRKAI